MELSRRLEKEYRAGYCMNTDGHTLADTTPFMSGNLRSATSLGLGPTANRSVRAPCDRGLPVKNLGGWF